jgi:hypothetical protein
MIHIGGPTLVLMKTKHNVSVANTALHYACRNEGLSVDVIKNLLEAGGKDLVLEVNDYGMTALHELCDGIRKRSRDNQALEEKVHMMVKLGGKELLMKRDRNDKSARDIAIMKGASDKITGMLKPSFFDLPQSVQTKGHKQQASHGHSFLYDAFLTHNWGLDEMGRDNHIRVSKFNDELKKRGFDRTWFDEEQMDGNINDKMSSGITNSQFVIVFVTMQYIKKVDGKGPKGDDDNCRKEFNFACTRKGCRNMIVVVMEDICSNTSNWDGTVGLTLCQELHYLYTSDDRLSKCVDEVAQQMKIRIKRLNPLFTFEDDKVMK